MELIVKRIPSSNFLLGEKIRSMIIGLSQSKLQNCNQTDSCSYCTVKDQLNIKKSYYILGVPDGSDQETVRQAFVKLVKRFHPDSGSHEADPTRFQEIENAYRRLQDKFSEERWKKNEGVGEYGLYYDEKKKKSSNVEEQNINHTAPQHRQYLTYGGWGSGTPSQREKQYQKARAETAVKNVFEHRIDRVRSETVCTDEQALIIKDKAEAKKIKTRYEGIAQDRMKRIIVYKRYGFERLVEDLIQESMSKGEFDNLPGQGKPLGRQFDHHNPYVDLVTHKLNQVMIDNGFMPEWIQLQKEIRTTEEEIRDKLLNERRKLGPLPLNAKEEILWQRLLKNLQPKVDRLNKKVGKYNLIVPMLQKQVLLFDLNKEAVNVLQNGQSKERSTVEEEIAEEKTNSKRTNTTSTLFEFLSSMLQK